MSTVPLQKTTLELPAMYADHHVVEVRRILLDIPGVKDVYASSAFQVVEVSYDPAVVNDLEISIKLDESGYLGEWTVTAEPGNAEKYQENGKSAFRHTASYEQTRHVVSFGQVVEHSSRPLWPCPGMGLIKKMEE